MDEEKSQPSLSEQLNAIPTPATAKPAAPGPGASTPIGRITNSGMASQPPGRITNSSMASLPSQPEQQAQGQATPQGADVPQWMKNYASYQNNGTPAPSTSNSYQTASPAGGASQGSGGGYQIIMVVMILACVAIFGYLYINKDKAPAMPPTQGMPGAVSSPLVPTNNTNTNTSTTTNQIPTPTAQPVSPVQQFNPATSATPVQGQPAPQAQPVDPNQPQPDAGTTYPGGTTYPSGTTYPGGTTYPSGTTYPAGTTYPTGTPAGTADPNAAPGTTPTAPVQ